MKRFLFPLLTAVTALILIGLGSELIAIALLYATEGRYIAARERFGRKTNTFVQELTGSGSSCGYVDTLYPHPYLGFVHHANPPCGIPTINNIGLFGPDFPSRRPDDRFVVLLTGGSVASQFARGVAGGASYLERFLNERYVSPNGRPFAVLNGADGAWKQPQQTILFLLYADAVHAVVTLDGFNEHYQMQSGYRFEYPANNFLSVNPLAAQNFGDMVTRWGVGRLRMAVADNPILSRSQAAYGVTSALERWAQRRAESRPTPKTSIETMFMLPPSWPLEEKKQWQIGQYRKYIRAMTAIARDHDVLPGYFVQPCPAIDKPLTTDEQRVVGELAYAGAYREMTDALLTLRAGGHPVISLLDVFRGDPRTLYGDPIHLVRSVDGVSAGYERIADRMARELATLWRLKSK